MALHLKNAIEHLKELTTELATVVEQNLQSAVKALVDRNVVLAEKVAKSDAWIDEREVKIEEECLKTLALHQPVAIDLRVIVGVLKLTNDLERIGDLCQNIAERVVELDEQGWVDIPELLPEMASATRTMLKECLDAMLNLDVELAQHVRASDDIVDDLHREMYRYVEERIQVSPERIGSQLGLLGVARYLERIADHTTNIAEDVIYMIDGKIVRHRKPAPPEKPVSSK